MTWFKKVKDSLANVPVEKVKEEVKKHYSEIIQGVSVTLLLYLCIKTGNKPINLTVNVNNSYPNPYYS